MHVRHHLIMVLLLGAGWTALHAQGFSDEFNKSTLATGWTWLRETPDHWLMTGTHLQIRTQLGALNGHDYNDVRNILLQDAPSGLFRCETKLYCFVQEALHNAGLVYYLDDDNYIRVSRGMFNNINGLWMETEVNGVTWFHYVTPMTSPDVYLRLSRTNGNVFLTTYSLNGTDWYEIGTETTGFASTNTPKIGVQAANGSGFSATRMEIAARFDYFRVGLTDVEGTPASGIPGSFSISPQPVVGGGTDAVALHLPNGEGLPTSVMAFNALGERCFLMQPGQEAGSILWMPITTLRTGIYQIVVTMASGRMLTSRLVVRR